jgi:hypothetical protein
VFGAIIGWRFTGQQSKEHRLTHCTADGCPTGVSASTSFTWEGGTVAGSANAFLLSASGDPVRLTKAGVEGCARLLDTSGPRTDAQSIVLDQVRFAADQLHADGDCVIVRGAGPLLVLGGAYGEGNQAIPHFRANCIGNCAVSMIGVRFGAYGASAVPVLRANPGVTVAGIEVGCTYENALGAGAHTSITRPPGSLP